MALKFADNLLEHILINRHFFKDILDHFGIDFFIISFNRRNDQTTNINCRRTDEYARLRLHENKRQDDVCAGEICITRQAFF